MSTLYLFSKVVLVVSKFQMTVYLWGRVLLGMKRSTTMKAGVLNDFKKNTSRW